MAQNSERPEEDTDENDSVQKRICIIHFEDCKHEEKFNYLHGCQNAEERFSTIHDIRRRRSEEPANSAQRMDSVCQLIPNKMQPDHGYHRECYQRFTMNLGRLKQREYVSEKSTTSRRSSTTNSDRILFRANCIFCKKTGVKKIKSKGVWTTESMSKFEYDQGLAVK